MPPTQPQIGARASITRAFTAADVAAFGALCGDLNPVHFDAEYATEKTPFDGRIVHGMLVSSLFSTLFGTELPGPGALYLGQKLRFRAPVYLDVPVTASVELIQLREDKPIATFKTTCVTADGTAVVEGEAVLYLSAVSRDPAATSDQEPA